MSDLLLRSFAWSAVTIALFIVARRVHRRWPRRWLLPIAVTPVLVATVLLAVHANYGDYARGTHWLVLMLGPATVAFAIPIYEQRSLIRARWRVLLAGMIAGSVTAIVSSFAMATLLGLDDSLVRSLLPRSITTGFAMTVSGEIGGVPQLTAVFVVLTGLTGAVIGDLLLARFRWRTTLARGALYGVGAHGIGTARAHEIGRPEGAVSGLLMVLVGVANVLVAPLVARALG